MADADKVALVIGGSGAIGTAICRRLAAAGHVVLFTWRSREGEALRLASQLREAGGVIDQARLDLADPDAVAALCTRAAGMGRLARVVHAAGPSIPQIWFSQLTPALWREFATAEFDAFFTLLHGVLPRLRDQGGGSIVAVTTAATARVIPGDILSAAPKAGIEMLVRQVAREEGRFGIRLNSVGPGIIDAGLGLKAQQEHYTAEIWDAQRRALPLRRFGDADEVAAAVEFLLSDEASYITGQSLTVDGGLSI